MSKLATYLHYQTTLTTKPSDSITFAGHSWPYFSQVRQGLEQSLQAYAVLPLRRVDFVEYGRVHSQSYLDKLELMAHDELLEELPKLGIGCDGLEYCLPGYEYGLGGRFRKEWVRRDVSSD